MKLPITRISIIATSMLAAGLATAGSAAAETDCRIDGGSVYFSHHDASLTDESRAALTRIADEARACNAAAVLIRTGGDLADERAASVAAELESKGVAVTRAVTLPINMAAQDDFISTRAARIEIRAPGQGVS